MDESNVSQRRNKKTESKNGKPIKIALLFLLVLIISVVFYFSSDIRWLEITFAHLGAFGIVGLLGCCSGLIANEEGLWLLESLFNWYIFSHNLRDRSCSTAPAGLLWRLCKSCCCYTYSGYILYASWTSRSYRDVNGNLCDSGRQGKNMNEIEKLGFDN